MVILSVGRYRRHQGSAMLTVVIVAAAITSAIAVSLAKLHGLSYRSLATSASVTQAQQYAFNEAEKIKASRYVDVASVPRTQIGTTGFYKRIEVTEDISGDSPIRTAKIYIDAGNSNAPVNMLTVNRAKISQLLYHEPGDNEDGAMTQKATTEAIAAAVPVGSVIMWTKTTIPEGWHICDGTSGTIDLRNRFVVGAGGSYGLGSTGGANTVTLTVSQSGAGKHFHYFGYNGDNNNGQFPCIRDHQLWSPEYPSNANGTYVTASKWNGSNGGSWWGWDGGGATNLRSNLVTSVAYADGEDQAIPHENRPPYYAVYYIQKIS